MTQPSFLVAAAQVTPVFLDRKATLEKTCEVIATAGKNGARLVVFPVAFFSGYPDWIWLVPGGNQRLLDSLYVKLVENSVAVPDETTDILCQAARKAKIHIVMGINERNREASNASLYNSLLYIDDQGNILGVHRKLLPTDMERTIWGQGNGSTLEVHDTSIGKLSGLICWENYMPLARYALYARGIQIYVAATWDRGDLWVASLRHIAKESGAFVIGCGMPLQTRDIPDSLGFKHFYRIGKQWINSGDSCIVAPNGKVLAGPLMEKEEILYAEIDPRQIVAAKRMFDLGGHYSRSDVFKFAINRNANPLVRLDDGESV